jgi:hypothetical protein
MLFVNVQRSVDHMRHVPFLSPIHNHRSRKTSMDPISIRTVRLDLNASCNENGPGLSLDPIPCFLILIIVKCNKLMMMEAQTLLDSNTSTCFMDEELM